MEFVESAIFTMEMYSYFNFKSAWYCYMRLKWFDGCKQDVLTLKIHRLRFVETFNPNILYYGEGFRAKLIYPAGVLISGVDYLCVCILETVILVSKI